MEQLPQGAVMQGLGPQSMANLHMRQTPPVQSIPTSHTHDWIKQEQQQQQQQHHQQQQQLQQHHHQQQQQHHQLQQQQQQQQQQQHLYSTAHPNNNPVQGQTWNRSPFPDCQRVADTQRPLGPGVHSYPTIDSEPLTAFSTSVFNIWGINPDTLANAEASDSVRYEPVPTAYTHDQLGNRKAETATCSVQAGGEKVASIGLQSFGALAASLSSGRKKSQKTTASTPAVPKITPSPTSPRPRPHICKECGATFAWQKNLSRHMRKHTGERPYACEECDKKFAQNSHLKVHMLKHSGVKPFVCQECGAAFTRACHLDRHKLKKHLEKLIEQSAAEGAQTQPKAKKMKDASGLQASVHTASSSVQAGEFANQQTAVINSGWEQGAKCNSETQTAGVAGQAVIQARNLSGTMLQQPNSSQKSNGKKTTSAAAASTGSDKPRKPYACSQCGSAFRWPSNLNRHLLKHTGQRPYKCGECGAAFTQSNHLERHGRIHTGERPYACEQCSAKFRRASHLKKHMVKHIQEAQAATTTSTTTAMSAPAVTDENAFPQAVKTEDTLELTNLEAVQAWSRNDGVTTTQTLPTIADIAADIQHHQQLASTSNQPQLATVDQHFADMFTENKNPTSSKAPGKAKNAQSSAQADVRKHSSGLKLYACSECDAVFPWPSSLNRHMLKHTGEKPYTCQECGTSFKQSNHLNRHMLKHTGQRPFKCDQCEASFTRSTRLKKHMLSHTRRKPHVCKHCDARFRLASNLKRHMAKHVNQNSAENIMPKPANAGDETVYAQAFNNESSFMVSPENIKRSPGSAGYGGMPESNPGMFVNQGWSTTVEPMVATETNTGTVLLPTTSSSQNQDPNQDPHSSFADDAASDESKNLGGQKSFPCLECGAVFPWPSSLNRHMLKHTGEKPYVCGTCGARFTQTSHLDRHMLQHTGERPFACTLCGASFTRSARLSEHMLIHTSEKTYPCKLCEAKFPQLMLLNRHMLSHAEQSFHVCDVCHAPFTNAMHLSNHMQKHKGPRILTSKPFDPSLTQLDNVKTNLFANAEQRIHICDVCQAAFTDSAHLKNHMEKHKGPSTFPCKHCGTTFSRIDNLNRHLLTHDTKRPHVCEQCNATFAQAVHLRNHMTKHTGERNHACDQCSARFRRSDHLKRHMFTHTELRPYVCGQCDAKFKQSSHLTKHMLTHRA